VDLSTLLPLEKSIVLRKPPAVPIRPFHTGLREAPGERKGLKDWGGRRRQAVKGGGLQALQ